MSFNVKFDINDYTHVLPVKGSERDKYFEKDFIINVDEYDKGNIDKCVWKKYIPSKKEEESPSYQQQEIRRLKTGVWAVIKDEFLWLPPNYYFALQYGKTGEDDMEFRVKRLKHVYFKLGARKNPQCTGTLTMKNRGDGETTMMTSDGLFECADINMNVGVLGIQSKTRQDAILPCWFYVQTAWQSMPQWLKAAIYSDIVSEDKIAEKLQFRSNSKEDRPARNVRYEFYPAVFNAMDGKHNMKRCILDEVAKWKECRFLDTYINYSYFIMPGAERRGLFDMASTPSDKECKSNEDVHWLWTKSDTSQLEPNGTTSSRVHRHYSNPLEGIQGMYDKWGDADANKIYDRIMQDRKNCKPEKLPELIRGCPLNDSEMFETFDASNIWDNSDGIKKQKIYLLGSRFKNQTTKEPTVVYGNLEWKDGIKNREVVFRQSDKTEFTEDSKFSVSYMPQNLEDLIFNNEGIPYPPKLASNVLGADAVDQRYAGKRASNVALTNYAFRDFFNTGIVKCPTMIYSFRPNPVEIAFEDAIKACVFNRAYLQPESANLNIVNYFEDRGYMDWVLARRGQPRNSLIKGDRPTNKSAFLDEIMGLINAVTNIPLNVGDDYPLLRWYHYELLDDLSKFNKKDTHTNDLSMSLGQALLGSLKLLFEKQRKKTGIGEAIINQLF